MQRLELQDHGAVPQNSENVPCMLRRISEITKSHQNIYHEKRNENNPRTEMHFNLSIHKEIFFFSRQKSVRRGTRIALTSSRVHTVAKSSSEQSTFTTVCFLVLKLDAKLSTYS